jgi:hypothetical protein
MQATKPAVFDRRSVTRRVMFLNSRSSMFKLTISERRKPPANPSRMIALFRSERMSPAARLTQRDDVLSAERPSTLLAPVESTPDAVEGFAERRANLSTTNIYVGTSSFESISAVQTAECAGPRIVELTAPISF